MHVSPTLSLPSVPLVRMSAKRKRSQPEKKKALPVAKHDPKPPVVYKLVSIDRYPGLSKDIRTASQSISALEGLFDVANGATILSERTVQQIRQQWLATKTDVDNAVMHLSAASSGMIEPQDIPL